MSRVGRPKKVREPAHEFDLLRCQWLDVGPGTCQRCGTERRLYSPVPLQAMRVCADCSQARALSSIPNTSSCAESDTDDIEEMSPEFLAGQTLH